MDDQKLPQPPQQSPTQTLPPQDIHPVSAPQPTSAFPPPPQPKPKKSFLKNPFFWIVVIIAFAFAGGYFFVLSNLENRVTELTGSTKSSSSRPSIVMNNTLTPTPSIILPNEIVSFPMYTNARFIKREIVPPCQGEQPGYGYCDRTLYIWKTKDDGDTVINWYQNKISNSGWVCGKGGAGQYISSRDFDSWSTCKYSGKIYGFTIKAQEKETTITLSIPNQK